ncbi:hypothetical protein MRX96_052045 [Rhipicephalus microplus]
MVRVQDGSGGLPTYSPQTMIVPPRDNSPARRGFSPANPPPRVNPDSRRRQACPAGSPLHFRRASSFGPPDSREKPMGPGRGDELFVHGEV